MKKLLFLPVVLLALQAGSANAQISCFTGCIHKLQNEHCKGNQLCLDHAMDVYKQCEISCNSFGALSAEGHGVDSNKQHLNLHP